MAMWLYTPTRKLGVQQERALPTDKECPACKGALLRLAERSLKFPYAWHPTGYICCGCNVCYIEVP